jgi:23S rRNA (adenine-N6)-dimethyltransferase
MASQGDSTLWRSQNFLLRATGLARLIERSGLDREDVVYEIGAGTGILTELLAVRVARVIAIEKDEALCQRLLQRFGRRPNVSVRCADFLEHRLPNAAYKVFANPPFDITAAIVSKLTSAAVPPNDAFLAVQREAAERYLGRPRVTLVSLVIFPFFETTIIHRFTREDFVPAPGVDVVMLRLRKRGPPLLAYSQRQLYRDFVSACFMAWRPTTGAALRRQLGASVASRLLTDVGLDPQERPSDVPLATWLELFARFARLPRDIHARVAGAGDRLSRQQRRLQKKHRTRAPRDDLVGALGRQPHEVAGAFDESFALEHGDHRSRPPIVDRSLERAQRQGAAIR